MPKRKEVSTDPVVATEEAKKAKETAPSSESDSGEEQEVEDKSGDSFIDDEEHEEEKSMSEEDSDVSSEPAYVAPARRKPKMAKETPTSTSTKESKKKGTPSNPKADVPTTSTSKKDKKKRKSDIVALGMEESGNSEEEQEVKKASKPKGNKKSKGGSKAEGEGGGKKKEEEGAARKGKIGGNGGEEEEEDKGGDNNNKESTPTLSTNEEVDLALQSIGDFVQSLTMRVVYSGRPKDTQNSRICIVKMANEKSGRILSCIAWSDNANIMSSQLKKGAIILMSGAEVTAPWKGVSRGGGGNIRCNVRNELRFGSFTTVQVLREGEEVDKYIQVVTVGSPMSNQMNGGEPCLMVRARLPSEPPKVATHLIYLALPLYEDHRGLPIGSTITVWGAAEAKKEMMVVQVYIRKDEEGQ